MDDAATPAPPSADADDPREEVDPSLAACADFIGDDPEEGDIG